MKSDIKPGLNLPDKVIDTVVGLAVVGSAVVGSAVVGAAVVGSLVVGAVVGAVVGSVFGLGVGSVFGQQHTFFFFPQENLPGHASKPPLQRLPLMQLAPWFSLTQVFRLPVK